MSSMDRSKLWGGGEEGRGGEVSVGEGGGGFDGVVTLQLRWGRVKERGSGSVRRTTNSPFYDVEIIGGEPNVVKRD